MFQRAAIVLLVVLNLGAGAWWWLHAPQAAEPAPRAPAGAARLRLVAELAPAASAPGSEAPMREARTASMPESPVPVAPPPVQAAPAARDAVDSAPTPSPTDAIACEGGDGPASGWRVWLPAADAAQAAAARIAEAGFSDYLVVRDGADAGSIALGRYGTLQAAQRRTAALRASGFAARCARIPPATPA